MFVVGNVTFDVFGDSSLPMKQYHKVLAEARSFILACYWMSNCTSLNEAHVQMWQNKMRQDTLEPPKLCALPPTEEAFQQNALRAHLAVAVWKDCVNAHAQSLTPVEHGWYRPGGKPFLLPVVVPVNTPLAPAELLKVLKCGCCSNTPCNTWRCTCKANGLDCYLFCQCRGEEDCHNKWTIYITMTMFTWICTVIWWNVNLMPIAICLKLSGSKIIWLNL